MSNESKLYTLALAIMLGIGLIGFGAFLGWKISSEKNKAAATALSLHDTIIVCKTDTCIVHDYDTIVEKQIGYKYVAVHDTIKVDSIVYMQLPITQKHYHEDSLCDVWVSGYEPNLDSLHLYQKHTTDIVNHFREVTKMPRLTAEIGCGAFYLPNRLVGSVGAEVRYNAPKMSYSIGAAYTTDKKPIVGAGVGYRFDIK